VAGVFAVPDDTSDCEPPVAHRSLAFKDRILALKSILAVETRSDAEHAPAGQDRLFCLIVVSV
jgi:hypothetical protein